MNKAIPMDNVPFFWTKQYDKGLKFTGVAKGWNKLHIHGDIQKKEFVAFLCQKDDKVIAAASMGVASSVSTIG